MSIVIETSTETSTEFLTEYTMPFGKHKGKKLSELDAKYLNFLLCQEWFNSKEIIENYIKENGVVLELAFGKYKGYLASEVIKDVSYCKFLQEKQIVAPVFFN